MLLDQDPTLNLNLQSFRACSGATTQTVAGWQYTEGSQLNVITSHTDVVTLTIGGNDTGFVEYVTACLDPATGGCEEGTTSYDVIMAKINNELPSKLATLFATMQTYLGGSITSKVYIVGYPHVVEATNQACVLYNGQIPLLTVLEQQAAVQVVDALNEKAMDSIGALNDSRFIFVLATDASSPFTGHGMCTTDPAVNSYFYSYIPSNPVYTAHPNAFGQQAYSVLIKSFIQNH